MGESASPATTWADLLSTVPPGRKVTLVDAVRADSGATLSAVGLRLVTAETVLWCGREHCNGEMNFECFENENPRGFSQHYSKYFFGYRCKHCELSMKDFAVQIWKVDTEWAAIKFGEWPPFGPNIPAKLIRLLQDDDEMLIQARRAESIGLGIGAFSYYRRIVENHRDRLFDRIIDVAKKLQLSDSKVNELERAKANFQFKKSVEDFRDAIPPSLLIKGHSSLVLLHSALSQGMHSDDDKQCLDLAQTIRRVLTELAEKTSQAMKDDAELNDALTRLMQKSSEQESIARNATADAGSTGAS